MGVGAVLALLLVVSLMLDACGKEQESDSDGQDNNANDSTKPDDNGQESTDSDTEVALDIYNKVKECQESETQRCTCNALVCCTSSEKEEETVHIQKDIEGRNVLIADIASLNRKDIEREEPFSGCRFSPDKKCRIEKEYIENQEWQPSESGSSEGEGKKSLDADVSYMICNYGSGYIFFKDAGQELRDFIHERLKYWIPEVMQLDGSSDTEKYLKEIIDNLNKRIEDDRLKWDQEKIDATWEACEQFYDEYGVQVDPRLLIAIVCKEENGSLNTSSVNKAADGQNGIEYDFQKDLERGLIWRAVKY